MMRKAHQKAEKMQQKHYHRSNLTEGLQFKDLVGMMKNTVHIDEFASKMGDDADIVVVSFFVRDKTAAEDIMHWFERGYDFVLDADVSPGEIKPSRYLVYAELKRRTTTGDNIQQMLDDFSTLTEFEGGNKWVMTYQGEDYPWSVETYNKLVPNSPQKYREENEEELNEMRIAAGVKPKTVHEKKALDIKTIQSAAGII